MSDSKTVADSRVDLAQIMTPNDANIIGKVFGGSILAMIDLTASATAQRYSGKICVTASFDRVDFLQPIEVGNLVTMKGHVSYVGRTSMEITIEVFATDLLTGTMVATNEARVTFVAIDNGKPTPVPRLICETREEKLRFILGKRRRERRDMHRSELEAMVARLNALSEAELHLEYANLQ